MPKAQSPCGSQSGVLQQADVGGAEEQRLVDEA